VTGLPIETAEAMAAFLLVFFRITGAALSAPLLSNRSFPIQVRIGLVLFLSILMFPLEWERLEEGAMTRLLDDELAAVLTVLSELAIGWTIGWIASVMVFAAQLAGHLLGQEIGFGISEVLDPVSENPSAVTTQLFFTLSLVGFVLLGGPDLLVHSIHRSFAALPPGGVIAAAGLAPAIGLFDPALLVVDAGGEMWRAGVTMALPGMAGLMLATAAMGILARAVPEMNVFVLGFTIRILLGLFTTWIVLPFIGDAFEAYLEVTAGLLGELLGSWEG